MQLQNRSTVFVVSVLLAVATVVGIGTMSGVATVQAAAATPLCQDVGFDHSKTAMSPDVTDNCATSQRSNTVHLDGPDSDASRLIGQSSVSGSVDLHLGSVTAQTGQSVNIPIYVENSSEIAGYRAELEFDPDVLNISSIHGEDFEDPIANINNSAGTAIFTQSQATGELNPTLANLSVEVVGSPAQSSSISFVPSETTINNESHQVAVTVHSGTVTAPVEETIGPAIVGDQQSADLDGDNKFEDINGDGEFNIVDVNAFFQHRQSQAVQDNSALFDFNDDGAVDIVDVSRLFDLVQ